MKSALLGAVAALLLLAAPARADITVTTTTDNTTCNATVCSLRGAITTAKGTDKVNVPKGDYVVNSALPVTGGQRGLTIVGAGADQVTVRGNGKDRVLNIAAESLVGIQGITFAHGRAQGTDNAGGDILAGAGSTVILDHVRLTDGQAQRGAGLGSDGGRVLIGNSLIDNNAVVSGGTFSDGGGIAQFGGGTLSVTNSTVFNNTAIDEGGGIAVSSDSVTSVTLTQVTIAGNTSTTATGGGVGYYNSAPAPKITGSILAHNIGKTSRIGPLGLSNCSPAATDGGGNVESGADCGFTSGVQNSDAGVATALVMDGGTLPVLPIPADSTARDHAGACTLTTDQRDAARPNGAACDSGAYEYIPPPPVQATPTPTPTATPVVTPTPSPTPSPTPVFHKDVVLTKVSGTVKVKLPGTSTYIDLSLAKAIPLKSTVDVRHGKVELTSVPKAGGKPETAVFYDGIFKVTQVGKVTNLALVEALAPCPKSGAHAAAKKPKTRRLWGSGKGNFRTSGKYSAATIRGTTWLVQDSCAGTLTRVKQGVVSVRDNVKRKTIIVKAPHQYVARPKR